MRFYSKMRWFGLSAVAATALFALPIAAQEDTPDFQSGGAVEAPLEVSQAEVEASQRQFRAHLTLALEYLRENDAERDALISEQAFEQLQKAAQDEEALFAYLDEATARSIAASEKSGMYVDPVIYAVVDLGSTLSGMRDAGEVRRGLEADAEAFGGELGEAITSVLKGMKTIEGEALNRLAEVYDKAAAQEEASSYRAEEAGNTTTDTHTANMSCLAEIGAGRAPGDRATACVPPWAKVPAGARQFSASGLIGTRVLPLERYFTCTKDQGRRGTCVGFAMTASMEMRKAMNTGKKYNLSEQMTYLVAEIPTGDQRYRYGLNTQNAVVDWASKGRVTTEEQNWAYNRSMSISDTVNTRGTSTWKDDIFDRSCDGYSGYCSGAAFQGRQNSKATVFYAPSLGTAAQRTKGFNYRKYSWGGSTSRSTALSQMRGNLTRTPVVMAISVSQNYMKPLPGGYLVYSGSDEKLGGGHAILVVGFVGKESLPAGAPKPQGNGYYITKNSWGASRGDCGYEYLDAKWVEKYMTSLTSFSIR